MEQDLPLSYLTIKIGQTINVDGKRWRLKLRAAGLGQAMVWEDANGMTLLLTDAQFLMMQAEKRLRMVSEATLANEARHASGDQRPPVNFDSLKRDHEEQIAVLRRRMAYVLAWKERGRPSRTAESLAPLIKEVAAAIGDNHPPGPRTVLVWIKRYSAMGDDLNALFPQTALCGNRTDKLPPKAREILQSVVEQFYLTDQRLTAVTVHSHVLQAFIAHNDMLPDIDALGMPSLNAVRAQIGKIDKFIVDYCRLGKAIATHRWRMLHPGPITDQHNDRWEIDHTEADVLVVHAGTRMVIGRPTVTVIIDRHTRAILGFYISFDKPSVDAVFECLAMAVGIKESYLKNFPQVVGDWPCWGIPRYIVADNAAEFRSASFVEACLRLGCDVEYTPILKAWYKATVERFIKTLSNDVFHRLPGTTFSSFYQRKKEEPPETTAVCTLDELEGHIASYIVDVYHVRNHRGLEQRPKDAWRRSVATHGILPPPDPDQLRADLAALHFRKPQRDGIEFLGLFYTSPYYVLFKSRPDCPDYFKIKIDRFDLTHIWFVDPSNNDPKELVIKDTLRYLVKGKSLNQYKLARTLQRNNPETLGGDAGLIEAYTMLDRSMADKAGAQQKADRRRSAAYSAHAARATVTRRPEDPPAFDISESQSPISSGLFDDVPHSGEEKAASGVAAANEFKLKHGRPRTPPDKNDMAASEPPEVSSVLPDKPFDPDDYIRSRGIKITKDS